jgi:V/A-type H+-transporting ATPase subunit C
MDEFAKNRDPGIIERHGDNFLISSLWKSKLVSFGPEPLVTYIIARENEIRALRIILTGKKNRVLPDNIRERLRDVYV